MLEKFVIPILDAFEKLSESEAKEKKIGDERYIVSKEYAKKLSLLDRKLAIESNEAASWRSRQVDLRKDLAKRMFSAGCEMTVLQLERNGIMKSYGIYCNSSIAMICEIVDSKDVEIKMAIDKMEKSSKE